MTGPLTHVNPFTRATSSAIKSSSEGAGKASRELATGLKTLNAVDSMIARSLKSGAAMGREIHNNLNSDKSKLQLMKNSLGQLLDQLEKMKKTVLNAGSASEKHLPASDDELRNQAVTFNQILGGCNFDGEYLLGAKHFKAAPRIGTNIGNNFDINVNAVEAPFFDSEKAKNLLKAAGAAADKAATMKSVIETVGLDQTKDLGKAMKVVIDKCAGAAGGNAAAVKTDVEKFKTDLIAYRNNLRDNPATALATDLATLKNGAGNGLPELAEIVEAGPDAISNVMAAIAATRAHVDNTAPTPAVLTNAEGEMDYNLSTPAARRAVEQDIDRLSKEFTATLNKINSYSDSLDTMAAEIESTYKGEEQAYDNIAKADLVETSQKFVDDASKLNTCFGVMSSGNYIAKQVVDHTRQILASAAA